MGWLVLRALQARLPGAPQTERPESSSDPGRLAV